MIDEVGQFVARDVQKMLDLQGIVQALGRVGRGKFWIVVTSQEKLTELVGGLEDKRVELARLMDRFPQELAGSPGAVGHLRGHEQARPLQERRGADACSAQKFEENRARLSDSAHLTADIRLPELTAERFVDLYPLLPYQIDLIIQVVSGLRTQGGASKHVGGANRTIIKLAQQLLINPAVNLADQPVGQLARIDQIYDLVETNIDGEVRAKIAAIAKTVRPPARAGGLQGRLPSAVRQEHPPHRREHRRGAPPGRRRRLAAARRQGGPRRTARKPTRSAWATTATAFPRRPRTTGKSSAPRSAPNPATSIASTPRRSLSSGKPQPSHALAGSQAASRRGFT